MKKTILGDLHNHKATVLVEDAGRKWIRKSGNADIETAFKAFLSKMEEKGFLFVPGIVNVIRNDGKEYDVEYIEHKEAETELEVHLFYKRCGSLLFLAYLFHTNDLHYENIVAHGEYPVIVDYETLLCGDSRRSDKWGEISLSETVICSHLLPHWIHFDNRDIDIGGITGRGNNRLYWNGKVTNPAQYKSDIIKGFEDAYVFCQKNVEFVAHNIHLFDQCRFRRILRSTQLYIALAVSSQKKEMKERESYLRRLLSRAYLKDIDPDRIIKASKVLAEEINAVLMEEVPLFWTQGNGIDLCCREDVLQPGFLTISPVDYAIGRLRSLSEKDCKDQTKIISMALDAVAPQYILNYNGITKENDIYGHIINTLEEANIEQLASGWIGLQRDAKDTLHLQSQGFGLYNGLLGILCCYAAVYYKTRRRDILEKLLYHYEKYRQYAIPEKESLIINDVLAGLSDGVGGHIKGLYHISELTGIDIFKKDAERILDAINLIEDWPDGNEDILNGYAGLAIALLDLPAERAIMIGKKILPILLYYNPVLTGAAHGAGGIALALAILGKILSTDGLNYTIIKLLQWENDQYDKVHHNWVDLRKTEKKSFMLGWCSGAPGIGMIRHRLLEITDCMEIKSICLTDIERAYRTMRGYDILRLDHLCCGNCSRLMALSNMGFKHDVLYAQVEKRLRNNELGMIHVINTGDFNAGLMQGFAGIGYAFSMYGDAKSGNMLV